MTWQDVLLRVFLLLSVAGNVLLFTLWGYTIKQWRKTIDILDQSIDAEREVAGELGKLLDTLKAGP